MTSSRMSDWMSRTTLAVTLGVQTVMWDETPFASQGRGGGMGTASHLTQLMMAILVCGMSAIVIGAGLIGAARRRWRRKFWTSPAASSSSFAA
jgi:hypothetical protein